MSEMIQRVAATIRANASFCTMADAAGESSEMFVARSEDIARAAIEAMREPTPEMVDAALDADLDINWGYYADGRPSGPDAVFTTMIDAALAEDPATT